MLANRPGTCIKTMHALHKRNPRRVSAAMQGAYYFAGDSTSQVRTLPDPSLPAHFPALDQPVDELPLIEIKGAILAKLRLAIGKEAGMANRPHWYKAAALALRDRIVHHWLTAEKQSYDAGRKRVYYLSLEFLIGRLFTDALNNMGLLPVFEAALGDLGVALSDLRKCEPDAALGNGGLGRLAACFME